MLNGHFENCYGLKQFNLPNINFARCNKAIIYAPNGVMKSSLSKVFEIRLNSVLQGGNFPLHPRKPP